MAKLEITFEELIKISRPFLPNEVENLMSDGDYIKFSYMAEILLFKKEIPIQISYSEFGPNYIAFNYLIMLKPFEQKVIGSQLGIVEEKTEGLVKITGEKIFIYLNKVKNTKISFNTVEKIDNGLRFDLNLG